MLAVPAAYALARLTGNWGSQLGIGIFLTYLIPPTLLFIPLSKVVALLGLPDSLWSIIIVYPSFTIPFSTWLLMGFFIVKLMIPMSTSGILTVVIFAFTLVTQEFVYALTFNSSASHQTVGVGVPTFLVRGDVYHWGSLMAACLITSLPIGILYNLFLDRFIEGFTVGAVKQVPLSYRRRFICPSGDLPKRICYSESEVGFTAMYLLAALFQSNRRTPAHEEYATHPTFQRIFQICR